MPTLEKIEDEVKQLPKAEQEALRDWLENMLEDELEFTDEFKAKIERGEQDVREGRVRIHQVQASQ
jgi:mRNA-degrading endonuclease RelE of RelBE toxin-antitoxin system